MSESLGARLRRQREARNVELSTIAEQTKIKQSLLDALEHDDVSHWPSGIFRRAYIRAYAHAIGLNPDDVVREFLEVHPEPEDAAALADALARATEGARSSGAPPTRFHYLVGSAIGSLSRLRRSTGIDDLLGADRPTDDLPVESELQAREAVQEPGEEALPPAIEEPPPPAIEEPPRPAVPPAWAPNLQAVAELCTELGRADNVDDVQALLADAAAIVDAAGVIVWVWDATAAELTPALVHGYSDEVLAQLPAVTRDADNATAAAFRSGRMCAIDGTGDTTGALVVPLFTPAGITGVLALELQRGGERRAPVRAVATIFAAVLAQLLGGGRSAHARRVAARFQ